MRNSTIRRHYINLGRCKQKRCNVTSTAQGRNNGLKVGGGGAVGVGEGGR